MTVDLNVEHTVATGVTDGTVADGTGADGTCVPRGSQSQ
jgi:hypothetical protein